MSTERRDAVRQVIPDVLVKNEAVVSATGILTFLVAWSLISHGFALEGTISSPSAVATAFYGLLMSGDWIPHTLATARRVLIAFVITMVLSTIVGVIMGVSPFARLLLRDYIIVGLALPGLFVVVFSAMYFGISDVTPIVAMVVLAFTYNTLIVFEGIKDIDQDLIDMSRSFNVSRGRMLKQLILYDVAGELFASARYAFAASWKLALLAEYIAAPTGIGFAIHDAVAMFQLDLVGAWTLIFLTVILVWEYGVMQPLHDRVFRWRDSEAIVAWEA